MHSWFKHDKFAYEAVEAHDKKAIREGRDKFVSVLTNFSRGERAGNSFAGTNWHFTHFFSEARELRRYGVVFQLDCWTTYWPAITKLMEECQYGQAAAHIQAWSLTLRASCCHSHYVAKFR